MQRWIQLLLGLVCLIVISSPQYVWGLFTQPLTTALGTSLAQLQVTFSILIVVQTFLSSIASLFPSTLTETFGTRHATANYGCLYMAQGVGSVLGGPIAAMLHQATGSWTPVFAVIIAMDFTSAALAILALKPMRQRWLAAHVTSNRAEHQASALEAATDTKRPVPLAADGLPVFEKMTPGR